MPKCQECGFESSRLQWTHFKYNCTGRFKNSKEYKKAYPNAVLVDPELAKKTAVTKENLIRKYGDVEGLKRWKTYKEKQSSTNSFEYKQEKYGWNREQFNEYNKSRSQTIFNMIDRYGEEEGIIRWQYYCERQAYTNTKKYFIEKYGKTAGISKFKEINKKKAQVHDPKYISEIMGISIDDAVEVIIDRQARTGKTWGSDIEKEFTHHLESKMGHELEYSTFKRPYGKWSEYLESYVIYDIKHKDCIIEFNGDYWHANPKTFKDDAIIRGKTALEIQQRDMLKLKTAQDNSFRTMVIWESDYKSNPEKTIKEVINWIQNGQK